MKVNILGKQMELKKEFIVIAAAVLILLGCLAGYLFFRDSSDIIIENGASSTAMALENQTGNAAGTVTGTVTGTAAAAIGNASLTTGPAIDNTTQIKVYVVGCVNRPGIVTLEKGQVIYDAVAEAGGLSGEADAGSINMVYKLNENTMLYIKSKKELEPIQEETVKNTVAKAVKTVTGSLGKGAEIIDGSGSSVEVTGGGSGSNGGSSTKGAGENESGSGSININTADPTELDKLPGVGEATAREIIAYRDKNGPFRKIEDIMKVPRIKQGRFESIKDLITVN